MSAMPPDGGRRWWAHFDLSRMNVSRIVLANQFEELIEILECVPFSGVFRQKP